MSVMVITRIPAAIADFEHVYEQNEATFRDVSQVGRAAGAMHHCFCEDADGQLMVIDEWPDAESFHAFFDHQADIGKLMADAGVTGAPTTSSYRILETSDRF